MQKNESYRQKENRKDNRLILGIFALVFALALGVRWYSDTHQPPVHPLKITIAEMNIPRVVMLSIMNDYSVQGELWANDNALAASQKEYLEGGATKWELVELQHRPHAKAPWPKAQPNPNGVQPPKLIIPLSSAGSRLPYAELHRFATIPGEWRFKVRASRRYYDPDTKEEWAGSSQHTVTRWVKEDPRNATRQAALKRSEALGLPEPTVIPPPGVHVLDMNKNYIAKLQWSPNGGLWQDVPRRGQRGYPLTIPGDTTIGFRAVKLRPQEPWPNWSGDPDAFFNSILTWSGALVPSNGLGGSEAWVMASEQNAISQDDKDLKTIAVTCGNTIKSEVRVIPALDMEVDAKIVGTVLNQPNTYRIQMQTTVQWQGAGWQPPSNILFQSYMETLSVLDSKSGKHIKPLPKPVGRINGVGPKDDTVMVGANSIAHALLTVPKAAEAVEVKAVLLSPEGNEIQSSSKVIRLP